MTTTVEIKSKADNKEEMKDWCYRNVGFLGTWHFSRNPATGYYHFWFVSSEDATAFKLKFGL